MNRSELRAHILEASRMETDDVSPNFVNSLIDEALFSVAQIIPHPTWLETSTTDTATAGNRFVDLPTDFGYAIAIFFDGKRLKQTTITDVFASTSEGTPETFCFFNQQIVLDPQPLDDAEVTFYYHAVQTGLGNDTDSPPFHESFHARIVRSYALWVLWEREEDYEKANIHSAEFRTAVEELAKWYQVRHNDAPMILGGGQGQPITWADHMPYLTGVAIK